MAMADWRWKIGAGSLTLALAACAGAPKPKAPAGPPPPAAPARPGLALVPFPSLVEAGTGEGFTITPKTVVVAPAGGTEVGRITVALAELCRRSTGTPRVSQAASPAPDATGDGGVIEVAIDATQSALGAEGYDLTITRDSVRLKAAAPAGLFYGVRRAQLLPSWGGRR